MMKLISFALIPFLAIQTQMAFANSFNQTTWVEIQNNKRVSYTSFQNTESSEYRATTLYSRFSKEQHDRLQQISDSLLLIQQSLVPSTDGYVLKIVQDTYNENLIWTIQNTSGLKVTKAQLRKGITLSQKEGERYQHQLKQSSKTVAASIKQDRYTATLTRTMTDSPSIAIQWPGQCNPETLPEQTDVLVNDVTVKMKVSCDAENQVTTSLPESPEALQVLRQQFSRYAWTTIKLPQKKDEVKFWTVNFQESWDTFIQSPVFAY